jgi:hypothetical protein
MNPQIRVEKLLSIMSHKDVPASQVSKKVKTIILSPNAE